MAFRKIVARIVRRVVPQVSLLVYKILFRTRNRRVLFCPHNNGIFNPENQHEVLFDKGTKFLVLDKDFKDGIYIIKLVEQ